MAALVRCRKARPSPSNPAHCPGRASYLTPVRGGCPAARRVMVLSRDEAPCHAETGFLPAGQAGVAAISVSPAIEPGLPGTGAAGRRTCHRPARAGSRDSWPPGHLPGRCAGVPGQCRRRRPRGGVRCPGKAGHLPAVAASREQPGCAASAGHGGQLSRLLCTRHIARLRGAANRVGAGAPTTARVPRVYLPLTCQRPGRETAGQRRI